MAWTLAKVTRGSRTAPSNIVKYKRAKTQPKDGSEGREICILQFTPDVLGSMPLADKDRVKVFHDDSGKKSIKLQKVDEGTEDADNSGTAVRKVGNWFRLVLNHVPEEVLPPVDDFVNLAVGKGQSDGTSVIFKLQ